jgi:hypothetical protein
VNDSDPSAASPSEPQLDPPSGAATRVLKRISMIVATLLVVMLHAWALAALWYDGPAARQGILVIVYAGLLVGSALLSKSFRPPLATSLVPFAVVAIWWWMYTPADFSVWLERGQAAIPYPVVAD